MHRQPQHYNPALAEEMIQNLSPFASLEGRPGEQSEFQRLLDATWGMTASVEMQRCDTRGETGAWVPLRSPAKRQQDERVLGGVARRYLDGVIASPDTTFGAIEDARLFALHVAPGTNPLIDISLEKHAARLASLEAAAKLAVADGREASNSAEVVQGLPEGKRLPRWRRAMNFALRCFMDEAPRRTVLSPSQYSQLI